MTTLKGAFPKTLSQIDALIRSDHFYLSEDDECYFLGEYTARKGFSFSETNQIILNFKKDLGRRGRPEWRHKGLAIKNIGAAFGAALKSEWFAENVLVPMPPSKAKDHPLYDDRILKMLESIPYAGTLDIRELIQQDQTRPASHEEADRPTPTQIAAGYRVDVSLVLPEPRRIAIFDDVLTTGSHYVAARTVLRERFPNATMCGMFAARRSPETTDFSAFFDDDE